MTARVSIVLVLAAIVIGQACVTAAPVQNISTELSRAQAFYKARQFEEALILLTELEKRAGADPQRAPDLLTIKLYMGLAQLGLNQTEQAKARFTEVCKLDPKYTLNPEEYPANAVAVFNEVRTACAPPSRPAGPPANLSITDSTFLRGKELYEKGEFGDALKYFNVVLALDSGHALAHEYAELAQQRLALVAERGYLEWSVSFDARQFDKAAATYLRIKSDQKLGAAELAAQIEAQYNKALSIQVNAWKGACAARDFQKLDAIRNEALNIAPGLPFSRDAVAQMQPCTSPATTSNPANPPVASNSPAPSRPPSPPPAPSPRVASPPALSAPAPKPAPAAPASVSAKGPAAGAAPTPSATAPAPAPPATAPVKPVAAAPAQAGECIHGDPMLAMSRLKVRVNPEIEPGLQRYMGRGIVVSIAIDEKGSVTVKQVEKANPRIADALKAAVQQWKFNPTVIDNQARCVNTELPIALIQP